MVSRPAAPALAATLVLSLLLSGCAEVPPDCVPHHVFRWDGPGVYDALDRDVPWTRTNVSAGPGLPAPDDPGLDAYGAARVSSVRYSDPDAALRNANAHFGDPDTLARLVVTVPREDDRPGPLFDALWDGLRFDADREAVREELLAMRVDTGQLVSYQAEVEPSLDLEAWLEERGGGAAAEETTPSIGVVRLAWDDWRMELRVPWRAWTYGDQEVPHRLQAMPHGPAMLLVDADLGWSTGDASGWLREHLDENGLPTDGVGDVRRGPIEEVCT